MSTKIIRQLDPSLLTGRTLQRILLSAVMVADAVPATI